MSEQPHNRNSGNTPEKPQENTGPGKMTEWTFTGRVSEYFRIWIVNFLRNIVTLGVYSAWAKVRRNRYLLGKLEIAGYGIQYHATGLMIFKGRAIAFIVLFLYVALSWENEIAAWLGSLALTCALPWIIHYAVAFRCRVISWNNIRFRWHGSPRIMMKAFLPFIIGSVPMVLLFLYYLTIGRDEPEGLSKYTDWTNPSAPPLVDFLLCQFFAYAMYAVGAYTLSKALISNLSWGSLYLDDRLSFWSVLSHTLVYFIIPSIIAMIVLFIGTFGGSAVLILIWMELAPWFDPLEPGYTPFQLFYNVEAGYLTALWDLLDAFAEFAAVLIFLMLLSAFKAKLRNLIFNNSVARERSSEGLHPDVSVSFSSDLSWWRMIWIHVSNFVVVVCSAFLLYPWAVIRLKKYIAARSGTELHRDVSMILEQPQAKTSAAGSEYTDLEGIDITPW